MQYTLMHNNYPVCDFITEDGQDITWVGKIENPERLPLQCQQEGRDVAETFRYWWENRCVPRTRMRIGAALEQAQCWTSAAMSLANLGVSLSDHYWVRPQVSPELTWAEVNCFDNDFTKGCGDLLFFNKDYATSLGGSFGRSPDASTNGLLRKHWSINSKGDRVLVKAGGFNTISEAVCEAVFFDIVSFLGFNCARTEVCLDTPDSNMEHSMEPCCAVTAFTSSKYEIVTANAMRFGCKVDERLSLYEKTVDLFSRLCGRDMRRGLEEMLISDYLLCNQDRHFSSFGLLRDSETLEYVGMCPMFDHGAALWSSEIFIDGVGESDASITFEHTQSEQIRLVHDVAWLENSKLDYVTSLLYNRLSAYEQYIRGAAPDDKYLRRVDKIIRSVEHRVNHLEYAL